METQAREMNQMIADLENRKSSVDEELKSSEEKVTLLRDIIANLENQLEQKSARETKVLEQLEEMKRTIDERDDKMRELVGELESLRSERNEQSDAICVKCAQDEDKYTELSEKIKEEVRINLLLSYHKDYLCLCLLTATQHYVITVLIF